MKIILQLLNLSLSIIATSCATIFTGTTQNINMQIVDSENKLIDARCSVTNSKGESYILSSNPGIITVSKGAGVLTPNCIKEGYIQKSFGAVNDFNAVNILFWPGFIVDVLSGSMHKYPSYITVFMHKIEK